MSIITNIIDRLLSFVQPDMTDAEIAKRLDNLAAANPEKLAWKTSIVDLLKLLDLDSSIAARKALAQEMNYKGNMDDSAAMNTWLHAEVMREIAERDIILPK